MAVHADIEKQIAKLKKTVQVANDMYAKQLADEALTICMQAIDDFYEDYTPKSYDRLGTLHKVYSVQANNNYITLKFNDSQLDGHRATNEYIYQNSFIEGWHGGAEIDGQMRYPNGQLAEYMSPSPFEQIQEQIESLDTRTLALRAFAEAVKQSYF